MFDVVIAIPWDYLEPDVPSATRMKLIRKTLDEAAGWPVTPKTFQISSTVDDDLVFVRFGCEYAYGLDAETS